MKLNVLNVFLIKAAEFKEQWDSDTAMWSDIIETEEWKLLLLTIMIIINNIVQSQNKKLSWHKYNMFEKTMQFLKRNYEVPKTKTYCVKPATNNNGYTISTAIVSTIQLMS